VSLATPNLAALATGLLLGAWWVDAGPVDDAARALTHVGADHESKTVSLEGGQTALVDATGRAVPLRRFERIASGSLVADAVLLELCDAERIVALTDRVDHDPARAKLAGARPRITNPSQVEAVLAVRPDLLLVSHFASPQALSRLRENGVEVFDLGRMRGMASLAGDIHAIGTLVGNEAGADALSEAAAARLRAVEAKASGQARTRGLYVAAYGTKLYGGANRTSYHDVLSAAGIVDVAALRYEGWPELGAEQILVLDPELFVTKRGMGAALCRHPGLELARPCRDGRIIELDPFVIDDPGLRIPEAAEALRAALTRDHAR
jgi:iron complex transport system substrate-binding protein